MRMLSLAFVLLLIVSSAAGAQPEDDPHYKPVKVLGDKQFVVSVRDGSGVSRYFGTGSLDGSRRVVRALVNVHGLLRNGDVYEKTGEQALQAAGASGDTLLITPQFLAQVDVTGWGLPAQSLRWDVGTWLDGTPASGPAPLSAFSVLDAIIERLSDRARFPTLREVVVIGHSAGAQLVQRYAVVGQAPDTVRAGVRLRFVVSNPSSYLYFDENRPAGDKFAPFPASTCANFNRWKYGFESVVPYVVGGPAQLEARYVTRHVTYLLGQLDIDPKHPVLDTSCAGEAEGPYRLARGEAYARYLRLRHPAGTNQDVAEVAGVGHDNAGMFTSACGVAVIFDRPRSTCAVTAGI